MWSSLRADAPVGTPAELSPALEPGADAVDAALTEAACSTRPFPLVGNQSVVAYLHVHADTCLYGSRGREFQQVAPGSPQGLTEY